MVSELINGTTAPSCWACLDAGGPPARPATPSHAEEVISSVVDIDRPHSLRRICDYFGFEVISSVVDIDRPHLAVEADGLVRSKPLP